MAKRLALISGDEQDAFSSWRKVLKWRSGERAKIKRRYRRRERREAQRQAAQESQNVLDERRCSAVAPLGTQHDALDRAI